LLIAQKDAKKKVFDVLSNSSEAKFMEHSLIFMSEQRRRDFVAIVWHIDKNIFLAKMKNHFFSPHSS
jgi:ABC-type sugar transport system ATPase subunit